MFENLEKMGQNLAREKNLKQWRDCPKDARKTFQISIFFSTSSKIAKIMTKIPPIIAKNVKITLFRARSTCGGSRQAAKDTRQKYPPK